MTKANRGDADIDHEEARRAALTVACFAADAAECTRLLHMLGLTEYAAPLCACGNLIGARGSYGHSRRGADGKCSRCVDRQRRNRKRQEAAQ